MGLSAVEERIVDAKGRIYISSRLKGRTVYMVRKGDVIILSTTRRGIQEVLKRIGGSIVEEYLSLLEKLGEPSPKDVEYYSRKRTWEKLEEYL